MIDVVDDSPEHTGHGAGHALMDIHLKLISLVVITGNIGYIKAMVQVGVHEDVVVGEVLEKALPLVAVEGVVKEDGQVRVHVPHRTNGQDIEVAHHTGRQRDAMQTYIYIYKPL